jgi:hypothetical protein
MVPSERRKRVARECRTVASVAAGRRLPAEGPAGVLLRSLRLLIRSSPPARWSLSRLWTPQWKRHLRAGGRFAAYEQLAAVLDGVDLAEDRLDDRLAPGVDGAALLRFQLARHPLLRRRVLRDRPARGGRLRLGVLEAAGRDVRLEPMLGRDPHVVLGEVAGVGAQRRTVRQPSADRVEVVGELGERRRELARVRRLVGQLAGNTRGV